MKAQNSLSTGLALLGVTLFIGYPRNAGAKSHGEYYSLGTNTVLYSVGITTDGGGVVGGAVITPQPKSSHIPQVWEISTNGIVEKTSLATSNYPYGEVAFASPNGSCLAGYLRQNPGTFMGSQVALWMRQSNNWTLAASFTVGDQDYLAGIDNNGTIVGNSTETTWPGWSKAINNAVNFFTNGLSPIGISADGATILCEIDSLDGSFVIGLSNSIGFIALSTVTSDGGYVAGKIVPMVLSPNGRITGGRTEDMNGNPSGAVWDADGNLNALRHTFAAGGYDLWGTDPVSTVFDDGRYFAGQWINLGPTNAGPATSLLASFLGGQAAPAIPGYGVCGNGQIWAICHNNYVYRLDDPMAPSHAQSVRLFISLLQGSDPPMVRLTWPATSGAILQSASGLSGDWSDVPGPYTTGTVNGVSSSIFEMPLLSGAAAAGFWRVRTTP